MNKLTKTQLTLALGALTLGSTAVAAEHTNPFQAQQLTMAYQLTDDKTTGSGVKVKLKEQANDKAAKAKEMKCGEGKCGEGKCGAEMQKKVADKAAAAKKKAGDNNVADKATDTKKKAGDKAAGKAKEMKCGEGKCGSM